MGKVREVTMGWMYNKRTGRDGVGWNGMDGAYTRDGDDGLLHSLYNI